SPSFYAAEVVERSENGTKKRRIKLVYRFDEEGDEALPDADYVLAHYAVPLIVFVTAGLLASALVGDVIILLVVAVFGFSF
ncbi:MAG: hypothetical protein JTT11_10540, partial [Candidatus Brockarchaeota archaeon]|nr:hypothetical protein [Candidatus Brockarchaeota archaeon]